MGRVWAIQFSMEGGGLGSRGTRPRLRVRVRGGLGSRGTRPRLMYTFTLLSTLCVSKPQPKLKP